jgi:hypothetical protein
MGVTELMHPFCPSHQAVYKCAVCDLLLGDELVTAFYVTLDVSCHASFTVC